METVSTAVTCKTDVADFPDDAWPDRVAEAQGQDGAFSTTIDLRSFEL